MKRLEAIESLEDLGAGFVLATHDLEIRGAGELLGESQSGELTEVGLTMYLDMLERAVKALKEGREPELDRPLAATAEVELRLPALLPESYVADVPVRLALYKRLAAAPDNAGIDALTEEIVDRFGPLPPPAHEPAARGKTQASGTCDRNPPTRSRRRRAAMRCSRSRTRSTRARSYGWCSIPIVTIGSKARSSCGYRSRPTKVASASSSPRSS